MADRSLELSMVYQGVGMMLLCVVFLVGWFVGCHRRPRGLEGLDAPLLS